MPSEAADGCAEVPVTEAVFVWAGGLPNVKAGNVGAVDDGADDVAGTSVFRALVSAGVPEDWPKEKVGLAVLVALVSLSAGGVAVPPEEGKAANGLDGFVTSMTGTGMSPGESADLPNVNVGGASSGWIVTAERLESATRHIPMAKNY